jgi:hypothetical protein
MYFLYQYILQRAGLRKNDSQPATVAHIWSAAIRPILMYGTKSLFLTKTALSELDKLQAKLLKTALGLSRYCWSTPLLNARNKKPIQSNLSV